ncbi:uncharacterized protein [Solanum lycopersicum]|uniref:uncharacterized protein n=1 Tax=Solanum lycopersicum TaxID=4081 RepID=UPI00374A0548
MSVHNHPDKANVVADALSCLTMGSVSHVEKDKNDLVKDVPKLARLGLRLEDTPNGGLMVHHKSVSSLVVEVKSEQHHDQPLMELKESVLGKLKESFSLGWDGILRYQVRLCVPSVDDLRNPILEKAYGSRYSIHPGSTKMYNDLREVFS